MSDKKGKPEGTMSSQDADLFSFLSNMHLSNMTGAGPSGNSAPLSSRKRKLLEEKLASSGFSSFSGKHNGGEGRVPYVRRNSSDDEEDKGKGLNTPQISQSGYDDESHSAALQQLLASGRKGASNSAHILSEIEDANLAANFDDSLSGLGSVDINTNQAYGMSEALMALPNLSISNSLMFKQEGDSNIDSAAIMHSRFKDEPQSRGDSVHGTQNFEALDLSNEEAHMPDSQYEGGSGDMSSVSPVIDDRSENSKHSTASGQKTSFAGSVSKGDLKGTIKQVSTNQSNSAGKSDFKSESESNRNRNVSGQSGSSVGQTTDNRPGSSIKAKGNGNTHGSAIHKIVKVEQMIDTQSGEDCVQFQYLLVASTSIATKLNDPTITYLNQGQAYELRLKKLGDISMYRKRLLKCVMRICFHERRLQYMEAEQIAEWSQAHPRERILDIDLPLSYGAIDIYEDPRQLNAVSFKWDPTRDTGIYIKVNCISTEFTPKKHGGEKGVPFRLQVETFEEDVRVHVAGCILQVFKLKGADRKHKQDRDKISKRPLTEQEKFSPGFDCTMLTELPVDNIHIPQVSSVPASPPVADTNNSYHSIKKQESFGNMADSPIGMAVASEYDGDSVNIANLSLQADPEAVTAWLSKNRYGQYSHLFRQFSGRDLMRLMREEIIALCGPSDGLRLFNDLHMVPVVPRTTFYIAQKDSHEYSAIFMEELTVKEFLLRFASTVGFSSPDFFKKVYLLGPHNIFIVVSDTVIQHTKPETIFHFALRQNSEDQESYDVILENASQPKHDAAKDGNTDMPPPPPPASEK